MEIVKSVMINYINGTSFLESTVSSVKYRDLVLLTLSPSTQCFASAQSSGNEFLMNGFRVNLKNVKGD